MEGACCGSWSSMPNPDKLMPDARSIGDTGVMAINASTDAVGFRRHAIFVHIRLLCKLFTNLFTTTDHSRTSLCPRQMPRYHLKPKPCLP
jgi:hypothetical protein